ncbi:sulfonate ABC transporter substrate-binding protein [Bradyrhizobium sp. U87765 SZCCT0131]|uniref:sulfonate ABC transporter substrate-binding protein n=1 Tax=unclassified Bradyrhizobium TaxID=2631580 RepID=UPI001BA9D652|nr:MULTISPECIES: sulfonate ABC transporter substrate-binding protein [unclassified Bradyrhizobium]MBR1218242.1 sulfonate ABC transporter substrate-binding protein [Bradyrhizobium sp. U87765 SZCCT0131]MBR1260812.1 sulfonate ABC transporter substrate-binding protein [Bradyrhizobium sp. U87765 SZCCT0134]MBR1303740.1 sulfonate ABC transporter substrate-binding protein [Bradyrhizobium sp. U87765 SZCCT0110]MBR1319346.1 sulfonate ABC transporter substrate-binding protein [Bradyrhizobium sp. U87765 SZC
MKPLQRLAAAAAIVLGIAAFAGPAAAQDKVVRIGFQKYGKLVLLKSKGALEPKLKALGYSVAWTEFPSGPPLLEAINVGAIDFGNTGEAPPVFAQAAGVPLRYVAYEPPAPKGEAILVPKASPLKGVAELKGKRVALNKGSNVHFLLVKALEKAGVNYADITPVFLAPADARAAFERGSVDAWAIWDPYQAAAEAALEARVLADGTDTVPNTQFYLASQKFLDSDPKVLDALLDSLREVDAWAKSDIHAVAEQLSPSVGLPVPVLEVALKRQGYGIKPIDSQVLVEQQKLADSFHQLGLIPKPITVSDIARKPGS